MKIDVLKFSDTNNFRLWRREVLDTLNVQNLKKTLEFLERPAEAEEKVWMKLNKTACGIIRSYLTHDLKYDVINETSAKSIWGNSCEQVLDEEHREPFALEKKTLSFSVEEGVFINDHINIYMKLLADLTNMDVVIDDEDKALILLSSLPNERYETFELTLINGRTSLSYSEVTNVLVNLELKKKDKEFSFGDTSADVYWSWEELVQTREKISKDQQGSPWVEVSKFRRISISIVTKLDTRRSTVQSSRIRRRIAGEYRQVGWRGF